MGHQPSVVSRLLLGLIRVYRVAISPLLGHNCRFVPTCSCYAQDALRARGLRVLPRIIWRVMRCNPFSTPHITYDPVRSDDTDGPSR